MTNPLNDMLEANPRLGQGLHGPDNTLEHGYVAHSILHLFRVETDGVGGDGDDGATDAGAEAMEGMTGICLVIFTRVLRKPWQRRMCVAMWNAMKANHELLAIFLAERKPGWGASQQLVVFLGCFASQVMGVTLFYHIHQCYALSSIFEEDSMAVSHLVEARIGMLISATLVTVPLDLLVSAAFVLNRNEIEARQKGHGDGDVVGAAVDADGGGIQSRSTVCLRRFRACRKRCLKSKACLRIRPFTFVLPWAVAAFQIAICSAVTLVLTAAGSNGGGSANAEVVPCRCRISHSGQVSGRWFSMVVLQLFCWLCVSRPVMIALGLFASKPAASWFNDNKERLSVRLRRLSTWGKGLVVQAKLKPEEASWDEGVCDFEMTARAADDEVGSVLEEVTADGEEGIIITSRTASVDVDEQCYDAAPSPWAAMDRHCHLFAGEEAGGGGGEFECTVVEGKGDDQEEI